jgi:hypothetical protein
MIWVAFIAFTTVAECDAFVEEHNLQSKIEQQCSAWDIDGLAPLTSPRPVARGEQK